MVSPVAKSTMMQNYYLGLFRVARAFGLVFAAGSLLIAISNIPELLRSGDAKGWAMTLGAGIGFLAIGTLVFIVAGRGMKQYRDYVDSLID